ncbi:MAG: tRNA (5-methylaminomethyl-2-thiouridine)(34)-methyltransferase MnmD, partial [Lentisphaeria bacterium]|nr:tRNA (5-methylaminomethyl-2-thiouridine)(34)-methyltransferase MnmD [Lentisphaeria bacterium]NQZ68256.1 tRNA (5-methylaminomethyl-2-thiouridine)(34)-methyltransferase MnmD [Lentisphaeria bacterium]
MQQLKWRNKQPYSEQFDDIYYSEDGLSESQYVFIDANKLPDTFKDAETYTITELGFGTGLNFLLTAKAFLENAGPAARLDYISFERYPLTKEQLSEANKEWPELSSICDELIAQYPPEFFQCHYIKLFNDRLRLCIVHGDALDMLKTMHYQSDCIFLDGFDPAKNPDMWSVELFQELARLSKPGTQISTYTAMGEVRRNLIDAGFEIKKMKGFAKKRHMLHGQFINKVTESKTAPWFYIPKTKYQSKTAAVIGAGLAGTAISRSLSKHGWSVDLYDRAEELASGASGNPLGIVMPVIHKENNPLQDFLLTSYFYCLRQLSQMNFEWKQSGVLDSPSQNRNLIKRFNRIQKDVEGSDSSLFYPYAGILEPVKLCQANIEDENVTFFPGQDISIDDLVHRDGKWLINDRLYDCVILATAAALMDTQHGRYLGIEKNR